jgi:hypothetical protein
MWREAVAYFEVLYQYLLGETEENQLIARVVCIPA